MARPKRNEAEVIRAEIIISWVLRIGVLVCGFVMAAGLLSRLLGVGEGEAASAHALMTELFRGGMVAGFHPVASPGELVQGVFQWRADLVITGGLLLLIGLPIIRVALTAVIFLYERDWPFVIITLTVLSILLSGIFLGKAL